jgi:hypothetical protein
LGAQRMNSSKLRGSMNPFDLLLIDLSSAFELTH